MPLEVRQYSDLVQHIKEPQHGIYYLLFEFLFFFFWERELRPCLIPEVICSVLSVSVLYHFVAL